jgi:hypothetical protein
MIFTTTNNVQGREVERYLGVVFGDAVVGVNIFKDLLGGLRDIIGGRSGTYERELGTARDTALSNLTELRGARHQQRHADGQRLRHRGAAEARIERGLWPLGAAGGLKPACYARSPRGRWRAM